MVYAPPTKKTKPPLWKVLLLASRPNALAAVIHASTGRPLHHRHLLGTAADANKSFTLLGFAYAQFKLAQTSTMTTPTL